MGERIAQKEGQHAALAWWALKGRLAQGVNACRVAVAAKAFESQLSSPNAADEAIPDHGLSGAADCRALHLSTIEAVGPPSTSAPGLNP